ncbi:DUF4365 domain-containing protein [Candidatus Parcubacteria bacterium]|nr:DUF4365 domain-containing protein [Candidatus Parcubacteria bacterium]
MKSTREIDRLAQDVLRHYIPPSWLIREQHPDIHIDYFIEVADSTGPTGPNFAVQLKGTKSPKYSNKYVKIPIKTKHLSYYLDKVKEPVFIISADVNIKKGYWLFIQKWLREETKKRNWRWNKKIVVKIPTSNSLLDTEKFYDAIIDSEKYMRELWPSSIQAAVGHERQSLQELDPRIHVDISFVGEKTTYSLMAKEDFSFNIKFKNSKGIIDRFEELIDTGKSISIDRSEMLESSGSPLLESILDKAQNGKFVIGPAKKIKTNLILTTVDLKNNEKVILHGADGYIFHGQKKVCFEGGLKESPLSINFNFPFPPSREKDFLKLNLDFNTSPWENLPVLGLPYYTKTKDFIESIVEGDRIKIDCEIKGNHIFTATSGDSLGSGFMVPALRRLRFLEKIRRISKKAGINPKYLKAYKSSEKEIDNILLLDKLILSGEYRQRGECCRFNFVLRHDDNFIKMLIDKKDANLPDPLIVEPLDQKFIILGKEFEFDPLRYTLTEPVLETSVESIQNSIENKKQNGLGIAWCGGPNSELIISLKLD